MFPLENSETVHDKNTKRIPVAKKKIKSLVSRIPLPPASKCATVLKNNKGERFIFKFVYKGKRCTRFVAMRITALHTSERAVFFNNVNTKSTNEMEENAKKIIPM